MPQFCGSAQHVLRSMFKDADLVDGYVIFNIRQYRYRLITSSTIQRRLMKSRPKGTFKSDLF